MADGLSWLLELDAKLDGALKMVRALDQGDAALKKLDAGLRKVEQASGTAGGAHKKQAGDVDKLNSSFSRMFGSIRSVAGFEIIRRAVSGTIDMFGMLARSAFNAGAEMIDAAAKAERTEKSFKLLLGVEGGQDTLDWIDKIAKFTEFTDDELKGLAGDLAKVGFAGEGLTRAMAATIDMAAFSGSGEAGAAAAASALERIKRTGKVDNRTLGGLGFGEKDFLAEMTKRTGLGIETLKKKLDAGKIDTEESLEALFSMISRKTGKDLGGAGVEMSKTMGARLKHLKDLPDQFFQQMAGTKGFAKISDFAGRLVEAFDPDSAMGQRISGAMTRLVDTIGDALGGIDIEDLAGKLERGIAAIDASVRPAIAVFGEFWDILKKVGGAMGKLIELAHDYTPLGFIADKLGDRAARKAGLGESALGDRMVGKDGVAMRAELRRRGGAIGMSLPEGAAEGVARGVPALRSIAPMMSSAITDPVRSELGIQSPSRVFEEIGMMTGLGFQRGIDRSMAATDAVIRGAFAAPTPGSLAGGGLGGGNVTVDVGGIHLHVAGGSTSQEVAEQAIERLKEAAPGIFQSAIERLAIQAGGA